MSLTDFFKTQQKIQESFLPSTLKSIIENQQIIKAAVTPPALAAFLKMQGSLRAVTEFNKIMDIQSAIDIPRINSYLNTFGILENFKKQSAVSEALNSTINLIYSKYELLHFEDDITLDESEEIEKVVVEQTKSTKRIITDIYKDNSALLKIEPRQFEEMIAELLYSKGFEVELTKQTRDNGYDILALKLLENNFPLKLLVECKRYTKNKVGIEIIRSFKEVVQSQNANKGIIVTTSYFTKDAKDKRLETPYLLDYKDKDDVLKWVTEYCVK